MSGPLLQDNQIRLLQWGVVIGASLAAAVWDATQRRIPNCLTGPLWLAGLIASVGIAGLSGLGDSLAGSLVMGVPFVLLFAFAGGGAGDAKLMGALGAWLGLTNGLTALLAVCGAGVVVGLCFALARGRLYSVAAGLAVMLYCVSLRVIGVRDGLQVHVHDKPIPRTHPHAFPYAVAVFVGVVLAAMVTLWRT